MKDWRNPRRGMRNSKSVMHRSKLVLGTAQLGMRYGLNNATGQPDHQESFAILDTALAAGINTFDTAWAYGTAEDVLGEWIQKSSLANKVFVISKMKPHVLNDYPHGVDSGDVVQSEIEKSLKRLHLERLDGYLLHTPQYMYEDGVVAGLRKAKDAGVVKNIGASIYDEADALHALELGMDYIQVPYNALDQRLDSTDFFTRAKKAGTTVFARSPFLQGLLVMEPARIPPHLSHARALVERFAQIAERRHMSRLEASLMFSYHSVAEHVVFGVETRSQLEEVLSAVERFASADTNYAKEIKDAFCHIDHAIVNPSLWSNQH